MAKCSSCSAPLLANTQYCSYCGIRNDIDIKGKQDYRLVQQSTDRLCPQCRVAMQTIELQLAQPLLIERCQHCFGLFFDPDEVEFLLEHTGSPVFQVNLELLGTINQDRYRKEQTIKYLKCPVCDTLMNRVVFGYRSGVVVDRCIRHGVWLDGGEITHLLEWKHAGGQLLDDKRQAEPPRAGSRKADLDALLHPNGQSGADNQLLETLANVVFSVFE